MGSYETGQDKLY